MICCSPDDMCPRHKEAFLKFLALIPGKQVKVEKIENGMDIEFKEEEEQ